MSSSDKFNFNTLSLHAGHRPDPLTGARAVPIYQTTSYVFEGVEQAASLYNLERAGHIYSRISNPTVSVLEERLAALEGGVGSVCTASGQAALHLAIATLMGSDSHIVASSALYGGTHYMLKYTLPRFGINTTYVHPRDIQGFKSAIQSNTKLIYGETIGNPGLEVFDIPAVSEIAHSKSIPLMIDSTFTTPYLSKPIDMGADIVMHSVTKFLGGHGIAIGGAIIDGGGFDWGNAENFPTLNKPYEGYDGLNFFEEFGPAAFIMRARAEGLRDFGACMSPANAFYIIQGVETLSVRMKQHCENAYKIAEFLESNENVSWVSYPGLQSHPDHKLAKKILPKGSGAILTFGIKGGKEAGKKFIEKLNLFSHLANIGDAKSLVIHPASTTHQQMTSEMLESAGIGEDLVRLSIGIEDDDDLMYDLKQALRASQRF
ncbi:MAG: O-acetylhomoserine aminocarboxypropyltransferase [Rhodospirillaceae bacterium]|nr:O-acetylhomoserine aminocarboxypropyltransferase [Rhodospirillaceae bacterium]|tara:strand:- start:3346 stop:4641 length:1296 start_codon:yes stop_codon:yes gene_type:complete